MSEDKISDFFASISSHVATIDSKLSVFVEKMADHERRLCEIEHPTSSSTGRHGGLVMLLARALLYAVAGLAAGAGASGILAQFAK